MASDLSLWTMPPAEDESVTIEYQETTDERRLVITHGQESVVIAQPTSGYGMLSVRVGREGDELERYYGFEMALDHAAEHLGIPLAKIDVPAEASDLGM